MANDSFPGSAFHPARNGTQVTAPPSQGTVDKSGDDISGEDAGLIQGVNNPAVTATHGGLPHPAPRPLTAAGFEQSYDPLDLLNALYRTREMLDKYWERISLAEDESIKRRMRGPLRGFGEFDGDGIATVQLGPVPSGEIWLIDRYIVSSNDGEVADTLLCKVFDGATGDPTSMLDLTTLGNGNVSDNTQPVLLYPNNYITFQWEGGTEGSQVYARVNYRSIAENVQFAKGNANVI